MRDLLVLVALATSAVECIPTAVEEVITSDGDAPRRERKLDDEQSKHGTGSEAPLAHHASHLAARFLPTCHCINFRNQLFSFNIGAEACAKTEAHDFQDELWCQKPHGPWIPGIHSGCPSGFHRCLVEFMKPKFPPCHCHTFANQASPKSLNGLCQKDDDGVCYPRNFKGDKFEGNAEYYDCPIDTHRCVAAIDVPTSSPTDTPTSSPTSSLTPSPTSSPTDIPADPPTSVPTEMFTDLSSIVPSSSPTSVPTALPTTSPTSVPTSLPTSVPTALPTTSPTSVPTSLPTSVPTALPTTSPTSVPTSLPTSVPTALPTTSPTSSPTLPTCSVCSGVECESEVQQAVVEESQGVVTRVGSGEIASGFALGQREASEATEAAPVPDPGRRLQQTGAPGFIVTGYVAFWFGKVNLNCAGPDCSEWQTDVFNPFNGFCASCNGAATAGGTCTQPCSGACADGSAGSSSNCKPGFLSNDRVLRYCQYIFPGTTAVGALKQTVGDLSASFAAPPSCEVGTCCNTAGATFKGFCAAGNVVPTDSSTPAQFFDFSLSQTAYQCIAPVPFVVTGYVAFWFGKVNLHCEGPACFEWKTDEDNNGGNGFCASCNGAAGAGGTCTQPCDGACADGSSAFTNQCRPGFLSNDRVLRYCQYKFPATTAVSSLIQKVSDVSVAFAEPSSCTGGGPCCNNPAAPFQGFCKSGNRVPTDSSTRTQYSFASLSQTAYQCIAETPPACDDPPAPSPPSDPFVCAGNAAPVDAPVEYFNKYVMDIQNCNTIGGACCQSSSDLDNTADALCIYHGYTKRYAVQTNLKLTDKCACYGCSGCDSTDPIPTEGWRPSCCSGTGYRYVITSLQCCP